MRFIRGMRVRNFRSLPSPSLSEVDNIVPIVGPNGSGKSNLLRALNLFFNGEVESGVPLDLGRDFHDPELKSKSKKLIEVELDLHFGSELRTDLQQPIDKLANGDSTVTIRKRWFYDQTTRNPTTELAFGAVGSEPAVVGAEDRPVVERLLIPSASGTSQITCIRLTYLETRRRTSARISSADSGRVRRFQRIKSKRFDRRPSP